LVPKENRRSDDKYPFLYGQKAYDMLYVNLKENGKNSIGNAVSIAPAFCCVAEFNIVLLEVVGISTSHSVE